jgi:hypothetical protein
MAHQSRTFFSSLASIISTAVFLAMPASSSTINDKKATPIQLYVMEVSPSNNKGCRSVAGIEFFEDGGKFFKKETLEDLKKTKGKDFSFIVLGDGKEMGQLTIDAINANNEMQINVQNGNNLNTNSKKSIVLLVNTNDKARGTYYKIYSDAFKIKSLNPSTNSAVIEEKKDTVVEYDLKGNTFESKDSDQTSYVKTVQSSATQESHNSILVATDPNHKKSVFILKVLPTSKINQDQNLELNVQFLPRKEASIEVAEAIPSTWKVGATLQNATLFIDHYHPHHRHG